MLNSDIKCFTVSHKTDFCVVWAASIFSYVYSWVIINSDLKSNFFMINEKTGEIRVLPITPEAQNLQNFLCFTKRWHFYTLIRWFVGHVSRPSKTIRWRLALVLSFVQANICVPFYKHTKSSLKDTHTTKWLSYTLLYKMASKTSKISRL